MSTISNNLNLKIFARTLIAIVALLAVAHIVSAVASHQLDNHFFSKFGKIFDMDSERNVPTVYTGLVLGCCAFVSLLSLQLSRSKIQKFVWILLSGFYFYLAFDEILIIHETFASPVRELLSIEGGNVFYHAWVVPAAGIAIAFGMVAFYLMSKHKISQHQKNILILTLALIAGVIFLEIIGTKLYFSPLLYKLGPVFVEEMLEVSLLSLILYRLTRVVYKSR